MGRDHTAHSPPHACAPPGGQRGVLHASRAACWCARLKGPCATPRPLQEYGLPSSHTLNSLCLNYFAVWYLYDRHLISAGATLVLYGLVAIWVSGSCQGGPRGHSACNKMPPTRGVGDPLAGVRAHRCRHRAAAPAGAARTRLLVSGPCLAGRLHAAPGVSAGHLDRRLPALPGAAHPGGHPGGRSCGAGGPGLLHRCGRRALPAAGSARGCCVMRLPSLLPTGEQQGPSANPSPNS